MDLLDSHYHCTAEFHLARLRKPNRVAPLLYSFAFHLSKKSGNFYASVTRLADYFGVDDRTVRKALQELVDAGFFVVIARPPGKPVQYRTVSHKEWLTQNPGHCCQKMEFTWSDDEQDALGKLLYSISGGRFKLYPNFLKGMRNTGFSDDAIAQHFREFLPTYKPEHKRWSVGLCKHFMRYLRLRKEACVSV